MMAAASKLFISSTFFPNSDGYIAALKTVKYWNAIKCWIIYGKRESVSWEK